MRLRLFALLASASSFACFAIVACSDDDATNVTPGGADGSTDGRTQSDSSAEDEDATTTKDGGTDADAAKDAKAVRDANGPGEAGADCVFNHDCQLALRCGACDAGYCYCEPGARGTGRNGIDQCDAGEQCASALCVEGSGDSGVSYCSDECESNGDCTGMLPKCLSIPFFGDFCARDGG